MLYSLPTHITYAEHHMQKLTLQILWKIFYRTHFICYVLGNEHKHSDEHQENGLLDCNTL